MKCIKNKKHKFFWLSERISKIMTYNEVKRYIIEIENRITIPKNMIKPWRLATEEEILSLIADKHISEIEYFYWVNFDAPETFLFRPVLNTANKKIEYHRYGKCCFLLVADLITS